MFSYQSVLTYVLGAFEYPQHMFWLRKKKINFQLRSHIWSHCVVSLSKTLNPLLSTGSAQEDLSQHDSKIIETWTLGIKTNKNFPKCFKTSFVLSDP